MLRSPRLIPFAFRFTCTLTLLLLVCAEAMASQTGIALARSPQGTLYTAWIEEDGGKRDLFLSRKSPDGRLIGYPMKVNDHSMALAVGQDPRVIAVGKSRVVVLWGSHEGKLERYRLSESADGGKTFRPSVLVPLPAATLPYFGDLTAGSDGTVHLVWIQVGLDRIIHLWYARWLEGTRFDKPRLIEREVCAWCPPSLASGPKGTVALAWKSGENGGERVKSVISQDNGRSFGPTTPVSGPVAEPVLPVVNRTSTENPPLTGHMGTTFILEQAEPVSVAVSPAGEITAAWVQPTAQTPPPTPPAPATSTADAPNPSILPAATPPSTTPASAAVSSGATKLRLARWKDGAWSALAGTPKESPVFSPLLRYDRTGRLWLLWETGAAPSLRLRLASFQKDGTFSEPQTIAAGDVHSPALAPDDAGGVTVAWQEGNGPNAKVRTALVPSNIEEPARTEEPARKEP